MKEIQVVASSGHTWIQEFDDHQDNDDIVASLLSAHDDLERIELLDDEGYNPEPIWKQDK